MLIEKFKDGEDFSLGAELEIRILHKTDFSFANEYEYFKQNISSKYKNYITSEFLSSMIEINTPVFYKLNELIDFFKEIITELKILATKKNLILQTSGTNALKQENITVTTNERYRKIQEEYKILLDDFSICGLHIHIGFENFEKVLKAFNFSLKYLPIFIALSASSLYSNGLFTGIHSYRTKVFDRLSKGSIPQYFDSFDEIEKLYETLYQGEAIRSEKDIWWDVRIQSKLKTLEFRICDAINDFERIEVLIGLARAVCKLSQTEDTQYLMYQVLKQNIWKASRYSMEADFILENKKIEIREFIFSLLNKLFEKKIIDKEFLQKAQKVVLDESISQKMTKMTDLKQIEKLGVF